MLVPGRLWMIAAVATIAVGASPLAAALWWPFELVSHFRVQLLVVALLLALLGLVFGKKVPVLLLAAVAGVNAWPLLPYLPQGGANGGGERLTILNVNVHSSNLAHDRIVEAVRASGADVVTIIELSPGLQRALAALASEYPYRFLLGEEDNYGIGVLSRHELSGAKRLQIGVRPGIETEVVSPGGRFRLMAVHPVPPVGARLSRIRNIQLDRLAAQVRERSGPVVLCGDFNLSPYSPYFDRLQTDSGMTDTRRGQGIGISWPRFFPLAGIPIDHCLTRGPFATESVERLQDLGSDHYPMLVTLSWLSQS